MEDPEVAIPALRRGDYSYHKAKLLIQNLIAEMESGVWVPEHYGLKKAEDLWKLMPPKESIL